MQTHQKPIDTLKPLRVIGHRLAGIPCQIAVTHVDHGTPGRTSGPPELCCEEELPYCEFELFDRKGYRAEWLIKKASKDDLGEIEAAIWEAEIEDRAQAEEDQAEARAWANRYYD